MSQASHKTRTPTSLTLNNPVKPIAKTKSDRASVDETESNQKSKDVSTKDTKDNSKVNNDEKHSTKKDKTPIVEEETKTEKNASKNDDKLKNGSSNNSEDSNTKISNGSHKSEESTTEEKKTRETRQKAAAVKEKQSEGVEPTNDSKSEKNEKPAEKPLVNKDKEKEKEKDMTKSNQKDKKQDKDEKQPAAKETPKKDTKDAKSTSSRTASPSGKDSKEATKSKPSDSPKPKSKPESTPPKSRPESTPPKSKKTEEKHEKPTEASVQKDNKSKPVEPVVWDNEEMEPLMMHGDVKDKTPPKQSPPASTSTPTPSSRILRMRSGLSERNSPLSLYNIDDPKNNTSTCVNLSTLTNPHSPNKSYSSKIRSVSGRRPMLREISYQNSYREHNRQNMSYSPTTTINESVSSGYLDQSQRSVNTSSFVARKRYIEENLVEEIESPKRRRLDMNSLLTLVSSPVTMLRNRLARIRMQCSTPNSSNINKDDVQIDTVTASCIDEPKESDVEEDEDEEYHDEDMKQLPDTDGFTTAPDDIEVHTDIHVKILKEENKVGSSLFVPNDAIKKKWNCSLM